MTKENDNTIMCEFCCSTEWTIKTRGDTNIPAYALCNGCNFNRIYFKDYDPTKTETRITYDHPEGRNTEVFHNGKKVINCSKLILDGVGFMYKKEVPNWKNVIEK